MRRQIFFGRSASGSVPDGGVTGRPQPFQEIAWMVSAETIDLMLLSFEELRLGVAAAGARKKDVDTVHSLC